MSLHVSVVSPEEALYEGEVESISLPGRVSSFTVLKDHAPMVSELEPGVVTVQKKSGADVFIIEGGFVEVHANKVSVLVEGATTREAIDAAKEQAELEGLLKTPTHSDREYEKLYSRVLVHRSRIRAATT